MSRVPSKLRKSYIFNTKLSSLFLIKKRKASDARPLAGPFNAKALSLKLRNSQMNLTASFAFRDFPSRATGVRT